MKVKDVKRILAPLVHLYEIGKVTVGALVNEEYDKFYQTFIEFFADESIDSYELIEKSDPVEYTVKGFRFIEEITIWIKEKQHD